MRLHLHVITVSDRVSKGLATDASGPAIINYITKTSKSFQESFSSIQVTSATVPDEKASIQSAVSNFIVASSSSSSSITNDESTRLILTTGGTGFAARDITPEAVFPMIDKQAPSVMHAMLNYGLNVKNVAPAWLSRGVAGVILSQQQQQQQQQHPSMIITLPGSSKAVVEVLEAVSESGLVHALKLMVKSDDHHPVATPANSKNDSNAASNGTSTTNTNVNTSHHAADRSRKSDFPMVSVKEALDAIIAATPCPRTSSSSSSSPSFTQDRSVLDSVGFILAEDAVATFPHPPFRASIKDGYAVITSDGEGTFPVAASFCAGADIDPSFVLKPGSLCRVNTGGPIPEGADSVIQVEDTELVEKTADGRDEAKVKINIAAKKIGQDIRPIGCDVSVGTVVVAKGTEITTAEVALLNSIGKKTVKVYRKPRIAVLSTGDELIDAASLSSSSTNTSSSSFSAVPPTGRIYDSNRPMLLKAAQDYTNSTIDLGIAKDIHSDTKNALDKGFQSADVIISTGGVSMGEVDWVKKCLIDNESTIYFGRVAMKPGKPTTFASKEGKLFFALPGNPVSAMVCFYLFVVPALRKMSGLSESDYHLPMSTARTLDDLKPDSERLEYHRCKLKVDPKTACLTASSTGIQASHRLLSMAGANGLLVIPPGKEPLPKDSLVPVMIIGSIV